MSHHEAYLLIKKRLANNPNAEKLLKHLSTLIDYTYTNPKEDPVDHFEENSIILKKTAPPDSKTNTPNHQVLQWIHNVMDACHIPKPIKEQGSVPNLFDDFAILNWAGIYLPECQLMVIQKAINVK